ncbi:MAG: sulfurtransferase complex subunit TusB [Magnetospirillum sp. WYHS-4]
MLNTINKSPFERASLDSFLRTAPKGTPVLFLEDGVYAVTKNTSLAAAMAAIAKDHAIYALGPDLKARAIGDDRVLEGVTVVDYGGFVDLVVEHGTVQSWL